MYVQKRLSVSTRTCRVRPVSPPARHSGFKLPTGEPITGAMPKLRVVATTLAAVLFAVGLSVGAAMAEDMTSSHGAPQTAQGAHWAPSGVCLLDGRTVKPRP